MTGQAQNNVTNVKYNRTCLHLRHLFDIKKLPFFLVTLALFSQFIGIRTVEAREQLTITESLIQLTQDFDLVYYGEIHSIPEQSELLQEYLRSSMQKNTFSAIATEFVLASMNDQFQAYLTSPTAGVGSEEESLFFAEIRAAGYIWTSREADRNTLRTYRLYKLTNPGTKICGIDHDLPDRVSPEVPLQVWQSLSESLKILVRRVSRLTDHDIVNPEKFSLREAAMAQSIERCLVGADRAFIHAGNAHTSILVRDYDTNVNFQNMHGYLSDLLPQLSRVSIFNSISPESFDTYSFYTRSYRELGLQQPAIFSLYDLQNSSTTSPLHSFDGRNRADFYILGIAETEGF